MSTKIERIARFYGHMTALGLSIPEATALRRAEMILHRWAEKECNGWIQRDGDQCDGRPYVDYGSADAPCKRYVADREAGALKRVDKILEAHPNLLALHQRDPRGCALYILRKGDLPDGHERGFPVHI